MVFWLHLNFCQTLGWTWTCLWLLGSTQKCLLTLLHVHTLSKPSQTCSFSCRYIIFTLIFDPCVPSKNLMASCSFSALTNASKWKHTLGGEEKAAHKFSESKIRDLLIKLDFLDTFSQCKNNCGNIKGFLWSIILVLVSIYNHNRLWVGNNPQQGEEKLPCRTIRKV